MELNPGNLLKYFLLYSLEINLLYIYFFRLQQFIVNQEWNDPKSKLQQCCLTLRTMDGGEPDIPVYKVKIRNSHLELLSLQHNLPYARHYNPLLIRYCS